MMIRACPECASGKHYNCPGDAWDDEADELVTCPCHARGHRPEDASGRRDVLAIVGSVRFARPDALSEARRIIEETLDRRSPDAIVSGGAVGIDSLAEEIAAGRDIEMVVHRPKNRRWEPDGFKDRNLLIVRDCTRLLAIRCAQSKTYGSGWTADRAEDAGRVVWRVTL